MEGSEVAFKIVDTRGNVLAIANEKAIWHAWDGVSDPQQLNLTFGPAGGIKVGNTGTGDASGDEGGAWGRLSLVLASLGLAGGVAGFALRRRAMTR